MLIVALCSFDALGKIWELADSDKSGALSLEEFCVAMYLVDSAANGNPVPDTLPPMLVPPSMREESGSHNPFA